MASAVWKLLPRSTDPKRILARREIKLPFPLTLEVLNYNIVYGKSKYYVFKTYDLEDDKRDPFVSPAFERF